MTVGIGLAALWLWRGPQVVAGLVGTGAGVGPETFFTILMFAPLLVLALAGAALTGITAWTPGDRPGMAASRGAPIGLAALLLATGYAALAGTLHRGTGGHPEPALLLGLFVVALQAGTEELLFRGWLQPLAARQVGTNASIVLVAAVFATLHAFGGDIDAVALLNLLLGGLLFGVIAAHDGGIAGAVAAHVAYNAGEQLLVGLDPNPGTGAFGAIVDLDMVGAVRWGGSDAGLNTSWAMTLALAAIVVPLAFRWRPSGPTPNPAAA